MPNLAGAEGSRPRAASQTQSHANTAANGIRNSEFSDW